MYVGDEVACGFPTVICKQIVKKAHLINSPEDIELMFGLSDHKDTIYKLIQENIHIHNDDDNIDSNCYNNEFENDSDHDDFDLINDIYT